MQKDKNREVHLMLDDLFQHDVSVEQYEEAQVRPIVFPDVLLVDLHIYFHLWNDHKFLALKHNQVFDDISFDTKCICSI
jgi:hypothetical protein